MKLSLIFIRTLIIKKTKKIETKKRKVLSKTLFLSGFIANLGSAIILKLSVMDNESILESKISLTSIFELDEFTSVRVLVGSWGDIESSTRV